MLRPSGPASSNSRARRRGVPLDLAPRSSLRYLAVALGVLIGAAARAEPVLHEYIELGAGHGPVEPAVTDERDVTAAGSPLSGDADPEEDSSADDGAGPASTFSIDRDTTRPNRVSYADPFTPTVVPFKRSVVYDGVNRDADLLVQDPRLRPVDMLTVASSNDEHFHASLRLELKAGEPAAIPSVAPGARLVLARAEPAAELHIGVDSAENWFVRSTVTRQVQLTLQVVADRRVFGGSFRDSSWSELGRALPPVPAEVKSSALEVARALGVLATARPNQAVVRLVEHFRRFSPSPRRPQSQGLALYRELALTARGICRHRSYAFVITALGLGIPTRLALNEAHAWVEVFDGEIWHRIDLGGAAESLEMDDEGRPRHVEPRDPFSWPDSSESGLALAERRTSADTSDSAPAGEKPADSEGMAPPATPPGADGADQPPAGEPPPSAPGGASDAAEPELPTELEAPAPGTPPDHPLSGSVTFDTGAARAERGKGLAVSGRVQQERRPCSGARVDVLLATQSQPAIPLGTLVSDERGEFRGRLVIPWNAPLGEHTLSANVSGSCGPGT
jgi:transglutaminase superfamily protein